MFLDILILISYHTLVLAQTFEDCGRTLPDHDIKGYNKLNTVTAGEFPHMCTLYKEIDGYDVHLGGASLIASNQVLTLATGIHKIRNFALDMSREAENGNKDVCEESHDFKSVLFVSCGRTDLKGSDDKIKRQVRRVSKILIHPEYQ